jgi:hypothetical protein
MARTASRKKVELWGRNLTTTIRISHQIIGGTRTTTRDLGAAATQPPQTRAEVSVNRRLFFHDATHHPSSSWKDCGNCKDS